MRINKKTHLWMAQNFRIEKITSRPSSARSFKKNLKLPSMSINFTYLGTTGMPPELLSEFERSLFDGLDGMWGLAGGCAGVGRCGGGLTVSLKM